MYELYRDDDISVTTDIILFKQVNDLFIKHNKIHTCAVQMAGLWDNKEIWYLLNLHSNIEVGLHCWEHVDYSKLAYDEIVKDINKCLDYWNTKCAKSFGKDKAKKINTLFPPWNAISPELEKACNDRGLKLDARIGPPVYNFHYWSCINPDKMKGLEINLQR